MNDDEWMINDGDFPQFLFLRHVSLCLSVSVSVFLSAPYFLHSLTSSGATDTDLHRISQTCIGLVTLDATVRLIYLIPNPL